METMNTNPALYTISCRLMKTVIRARFFILLVAVLALPFITAVSASYSERRFGKSAAPAVSNAVVADASAKGSLDAASLNPLPVMPQLLQPESITVSLGTCGGTAITTANLGQTICVRLDNAPLGLRPTQILRRISIVHPSGYVVAKANVTTNPTDLSFIIPALQTSVIGIDTVDNRGTWRVVDSSTATGAIKASASFDVAGVTDLSLLSSVTTSGALAPGENITFNIYLINYGPDSAENVVVTDDVPANTTFVSEVASDPNFQCTNPQPGDTSGTTTCSIDSLPRGSKVKFSITYNVNSGTPVGTVIGNVAQVVTSTSQRSTRDNVTKAAALVAEAAAASSCTVTCPANVVATANTTQNNQLGAFVRFSSASVSGDCGAVSNSPASGSFFTVGTHTVTSSSEVGGASCTFTVKVLDTPAPTISCPADKTATAAVGADDATVDVGTPTFTASGGGSVVGIRSDSTPAVVDDDGNVVTPAVPRPLTDPYPVGTTGITWTVTDADGRTASCTQKITVSANACGADSDTEPPTITAPDDVTVGTGPGNTGCTVTLDDELGQADAHDNCTVSVSVSGIPAGNDFAPGTYTLTYTARDGAGHTATDTQVVTVIDNTPPVIEAPPDATYTCLSEVPAANPSQATRGQMFDPAGNPLPLGPPFDNCGTPVVTVTESATGVGSATNPRIITRTFKATDSAGNFSTAVQTITVADGVPPTITAPPSVTAYTGPGATSCSTVVSNATLGTPSASDNCAGVTVTRSPSGNTFSVGTTDVVWTATDAVGNTATAHQSVTVIDNTPPVFTGGPSDIVLEPSCPLGAIATFTAPTATDNCGSVTVAQTAGGTSGSVFPIGTTTVTFKATDGSSNTSLYSFTVTVKTPAQVVQDMETRVQALQPPLNGVQVQGLLSKLDAALSAINSGQTNVACNKLADFISQVTAYINNGTLTSAQGQPLINSAAKVRNTMGCTSNGCS